MIMILIFVLIIYGVAATDHPKFETATVQLEGSCPKIKYITNVDLNGVVGWWYVGFTSLNKPICLSNNEGLTVYAAQYNETHVNLDMCCRSKSNPKIAVCGVNVGSGTVSFTPTIGAYAINFYNTSYLAHILDTDYDKYEIVYGCKSSCIQGSRQCSEPDELIIVFTRDCHLSKKLESRVYDILQRNGIEWWKAKSVKQGGSIPYTPGSRQCNEFI